MHAFGQGISLGLRRSLLLDAGCSDRFALHSLTLRSTRTPSCAPTPALVSKGTRLRSPTGSAWGSRPSAVLGRPGSQAAACCPMWVWVLRSAMRYVRPPVGWVGERTAALASASALVRPRLSVSGCGLVRVGRAPAGVGCVDVCLPIGHGAILSVRRLVCVLAGAATRPTPKKVVSLSHLVNKGSLKIAILCSFAGKKNLLLASIVGLISPGETTL
jgi:hypothetical protein